MSGITQATPAVGRGNWGAEGGCGPHKVTCQPRGSVAAFWNYTNKGEKRPPHRS